MGSSNGLANLDSRMDKIGKNYVGKTGFGVAVGLLAVSIVTALILGGISLHEKTGENLGFTNQITANFQTGDPTSTGVCVSLNSGGKYEVSLNYSNLATSAYIQYLNGVSPGEGQSNRVLVLDSTKGISGISTLRADVLYGQLGDSTSNNNAYVTGLSVASAGYFEQDLYVTGKSYLVGGASVTGGLCVSGGACISGGLCASGDSYLQGNLVTGDTTTNTVSGTNSSIVGGEQNQVSGNSSVTMAGISNSVTADMSFAIGGFNNIVSGSSSGIISGFNNTINPTSSHSFILGGQQNVINDSNADSCILGGVCHFMDNISGYSAIVGGLSCSITDNSDKSFIGGGENNSINQVSRNSGIISGSDNKIIIRNSHSFIGGGQNNSVIGADSGFSSLIGGKDNTIDSDYTSITGGVGLSTVGGPGSSWSHSLLCGKYNDPNFFPWDNCISQTLPGVSYRFAVGSGTDSGTSNLAFSVDDVGNLYFGTSAGASIYQRISATEYTAKTFTIQHPTITDRWLRHGCLEGPEGGVYYRGKGEAPTIISLPDYVVHIAVNFTVQITPIGEPRLMSASEVSADGQFRVYGEGRFHWNVTGERISLEPEPLKSEVHLRNIGPYSWEY